MIKKLAEYDCLSSDDRVVMTYLLNSITISPEYLNYLIIFVFLLVAIGIDLGFVFFS
ncbi:MAG: hypothetical protein JJD96_08265 [Thermoleophilia bacterium]|nr:hypothetical protein [Thermoleophilia bacterium]